MTVEPLTFSVITPCLNSAAFFEKTLHSLFLQEGDFYIQSIVMDGGSTDTTVNILSEMEKSLAEGKYGTGCLGVEFDWTSEKDCGQSDALNKALAKVQGDVVVWLNADDWFEPGAFQAVAEVFSTDKSLDLVVGNCLQMTSEAEVLEGAPDRSFVKDSGLFSPFTGGSEWLLVTPEVFFKRECIKDFHFDLCLDYFMDVDLWMHLFLSHPKWRKIERTLACFRWHDECKTLKAWNNFLPRLLVEDQILFSRYQGRLDVSAAKGAFVKLMVHFISNWRKAGSFETNNAILAKTVRECDVLDQKAKDLFFEMYALATEQDRQA